MLQPIALISHERFSEQPVIFPLSSHPHSLASARADFVLLCWSLSFASSFIDTTLGHSNVSVKCARSPRFEYCLNIFRAHMDCLTIPLPTFIQLRTFSTKSHFRSGQSRFRIGLAIPKRHPKTVSHPKAVGHPKLARQWQLP